MAPSDRKAAAKVIDKGNEFDAARDDDEPTTEELVEMLRKSIEDVKAGRTRPAREFLRELREILDEDDDAGRDHKDT
ncbi:MAG: hypothetical protein OXE52_13600 [Chloroflexi bacterium]|nr:hypothetical protein [Chloroflexota bacterium]